MNTQHTELRIGLLLSLFLIILACSASAQAADSALVNQKTLQVGDSFIIECVDVTRTAVGDPVIADVVALSSKEILVNAKSPGRTVVYVWDKPGRSAYSIEVKSAELDMDELASAIVAELDDDRIEVRPVGSTIILEGVVSRKAEADRAERIATAVAEMAAFRGVYTPEGSSETRSIARPEGDTVRIESVRTDRNVPVTANVDLRVPKVVNLIQIERPVGDVSAETLATAEAIRQALQSSTLVVRALPGSVVLVEGKVGTQADLDHISLLLKGWEKQGKTDKGPETSIDEVVTIVNAVKVDTSVARQIMVRAQVVDINKAALKDFGLEWGKVTSQATGLSSIEDPPWIIGQSGQGPFDVFGGGSLFRFDPIGARVRALEQQNKAKVLSEPNLMVVDGREASMLVGGEIPVPLVQSQTVGGVAAITVEYKEFGVRLKVQPNVTGSDSLQLKVAPEVSSLDYANAVSFGGTEVPALRKRQAETTVNIKDGQSLVIGGLLQNDTAKLVKKIPLLGDLPIIGQLFRSTNFVKGESELVIIVTPQILNPTAASGADTTKK